MTLDKITLGLNRQSAVKWEANCELIEQGEAVEKRIELEVV